MNFNHRGWWTNKSMKKKLKYPEYIYGVKQEQNIIKRLCIRIWYSKMFRLLFIYCGWIWQMPLILFICKQFDIRAWSAPISLTLYLILLFLGEYFSNSNNLRKIGRDIYGNKISERRKEKENESCN